MTFEQVAQQYLAVKESRWGAHADSTAKSVIRTHLVAKLGHRRLEELTSQEIQAFVDVMVSDDASESLLRKAVEDVRAILDHAQELGLI